MNLQHFFNNVTVRLGYYDWRLNLKMLSSEGYCWKHSKTIDIGLDNGNPKELILHELAHINTCRFCNQKHNFDFWKCFEDLMRRFLPGVEISQAMRFHQSYVSKGVYGVAYEHGAKIYSYVVTMKES